jgi:hypothetical protein
MILLLAVVAGLLLGLARSWAGGRRYQPAPLAHIWILALAILPEVLAFYFAPVAYTIPNRLASLCLITSLIGLLIFVGLNLRWSGVWILGVGLVLNLLVIMVNGGWMPISPELASILLPGPPPGAFVVGARYGWSKDIVLARSSMHLWWLSDCFLLPSWVPKRVAFSLGDLLVAFGAFWLLWAGGRPAAEISQKPVQNA